MVNREEQRIIKYFQKEINNGLSKELGIILGQDNEIQYNHKSCNKEYDILICGNKRLINGVPIKSPYNIEIETSRCTKGTINNKMEEGKLLSFIIHKGLSRNAKKDNNSYYSIIEYNNNGFRNKIINFNNKYAKSLICEKDDTAVQNLNVLEDILKTPIDAKLKSGVLFFLGDLLTNSLKIGNKSVKRVFLEPYISMIRLCIGKKGEKCFFDNSMIREKIKNYELRDLENPFSSNNYSDNDVISLITYKESNKIILNKLCQNSEVDKIYYVGGTKLEVRAGSSINKIKKF